MIYFVGFNFNASSSPNQGPAALLTFFLRVVGDIVGESQPGVLVTLFGSVLVVTAIWALVRFATRERTTTGGRPLALSLILFGLLLGVDYVRSIRSSRLGEPLRRLRHLRPRRPVPRRLGPTSRLRTAIVGTWSSIDGATHWWTAAPLLRSSFHPRSSRRRKVAHCPHRYTRIGQRYSSGADDARMTISAWDR